MDTSSEYRRGLLHGILIVLAILAAIGLICALFMGGMMG
jgi:hypothetical protein